MAAALCFDGRVSGVLRARQKRTGSDMMPRSLTRSIGPAIS
jgi:hypothetical protein